MFTVHPLFERVKAIKIKIKFKHWFEFIVKFTGDYFPTLFHLFSAFFCTKKIYLRVSNIVEQMKMQSQANGMATRQLQYDIEEVQGLIRYATNRNNRLKKLFLAQTTFLTSMQIDIHYIFMNTDKERLKETIRVNLNTIHGRTRTEFSA